MEKPEIGLQTDSEQNAHDVKTKSVPTFYFIGVTTGKSSINKVFPLWMKELGHPEIVLEGMDLKIHDTAGAYRAAVAQMKYDPLSIGALVTTHKIDLYEAAKDMFDYLDPYAEITGELSSISKLEGRLEGHAKDPITAGLSMDHITKDGYFSRTRGDVLIFGAGGSSVSTVLHLISKKDKADRPRRIIVVNRSPMRLHRMQAMVDTLPTDIEMTYIENADPRRNDEIMAELPEGSVVINATGMGKDTPGSPITDDGLFPRHGIAWEFNYRGELDFLHQAERQVESRDLFVEDGWLYFVHGWSQVVGQVLHIDITEDVFARLEQAAATVRG
ncbi:MAG: shikimate dehydrogenase [Anaerolineae bacterium]